MPVLEFGPDTNGWLTIQDDGGQSLGFLVWVGDNTMPGYETYQDGQVYWMWNSTPFPEQNFTMITPVEPPPEYSTDMMAFPNKCFATQNQLTEERNVSVTPPRTAYRVTPTPNNINSSSFGLIADTGPNEASLRWSASGDKPPGQSYFWPYSSPTATLAFQYCTTSPITFSVGTTFFPVSETQIS